SCVPYVFFQAEDGIRDDLVTGVQTCALPICPALLPPWLRTTISTFAVSTSIIFPLPSSPHCAPTKIVLAIAIGNGQKIFPMHPRSEERRVGKEGSLWWWRYR